ncbi:Cytochrome P450 monooxygenase hmp1 [Diaporthe amygdali]|uniref:Cytochrome P450 monooxygenase hmp1 n=1 Tax=Phomopsis amygdali TaxID=1214568 RepID=UPI0022FE0CAE|nr:Cytochrome P450 monooxygenase hmp1 [Diaporthe amygdali]KAJ0117746.1 Cytochrome P450 monooxygenase hmp1 [Diaporthe amygdali]
MLFQVTTSVSWQSVLLYGSGLLVILLAVVRPLYNVYFHPLRKYPGPKLWAASSLPWGFSFLAGEIHNSLMDLHNKYGSVVRVAPDELSFSSPDAWEDVYGRYKAGKRKENMKPNWYASRDSNDILGAELGDHGRIRKVLDFGFTTSAMLDQEPAIMGFVDLLFERLKARAGDASVDVWKWYLYTLFDITGNLAYGEPFGCLEQSMMHPWVDFVISNIKLTYILLLCMRIPFFFFYSPVIATSMSREELYSNALTLTLAGAETTASALSAVTYMLGTHPDVKAKADQELRATFSRESEIDMQSSMKLQYLAAVIDEAFRYHPPGPNALWRQTPPEGNWILGEWIPGKTIVGIPSRVIYRSECNFKRADEFIPERWLSDEKGPEFANDRRDAFQPFSYGPRNCLGMNLARAEMHYIIARLLWNFDIELTADSRDWLHRQKSYLMWEKGGLYVHLRLKQHAI